MNQQPDELLAPYFVGQIDVPLCAADLEGQTAPEHIDAQLDHKQAISLRRVFLALDAGGFRLRNGRRVIAAADAIRWLLEQITVEALRISLESERRQEQ